MPEEAFATLHQTPKVIYNKEHTVNK
jgi:hypothetical protein